jgi:hypothetical protein
MEEALKLPDVVMMDGWSPDTKRIPDLKQSREYLQK